MNRKERFKKSYEYLRSKGRIHTQKDAAEKMKTTQQNMSAALKGNEKVLTDNFIIRFCAAFEGLINSEWLLTGEGSMLIGDITGDNNAIGHGASVSNSNDSKIVEKLLDEISEQRKLVSESQRQVDRLLSIVEKMTSNL